jgi:hypothetical protein
VSQNVPRNSATTRFLISLFIIAPVLSGFWTTTRRDSRALVIVVILGLVLHWPVANIPKNVLKFVLGLLLAGSRKPNPADQSVTATNPAASITDSETDVLSHLDFPECPRES